MKVLTPSYGGAVPKVNLSASQKQRLAVALALLSFNCGPSGIKFVMSRLGIRWGQIGQEHALAIVQDKVTRAEKNTACQNGNKSTESPNAWFKNMQERPQRDYIRVGRLQFIDYKYYLAHQIHPVVARLCDPIEGTDSAHIAECLGLDPSGYRHTARQEEDQGQDLVTLQLTMEERFQDCERLTIPCPSEKCGRVIVLDSVFTGSDSSIAPVLQACPNPECRKPLWTLKNKLKNLMQLRMHKHINKYYQGWLKCEDAGCNARTNKVPLIMQRGHPICSSCDRGYLRVEYTDSALYTQLSFYEYVFDMPKALTFLNEREKAQTRKTRNDIVEVYRELKNHVTRWLDRSAYSNIDLGKLFGGLGLAPRPALDVAVKEEKSLSSDFSAAP